MRYIRIILNFFFIKLGVTAGGVVGFAAGGPVGAAAGGITGGLVYDEVVDSEHKYVDRQIYKTFIIESS